MRNTSIATYIKDEEGWGRIPLKISRTISNPSYSIDVEKAGKRVIKKKAQELIDDLFNKGEDKQPVEGEQPKEEMPVKDLLKGLFK
jgi:hypothetical protein